MCSCSLDQSSSLIEPMIERGSRLSLQPQREEVRAEERERPSKIGTFCNTSG